MFHKHGRIRSSKWANVFSDYDQILKCKFKSNGTNLLTVSKSTHIKLSNLFRVNASCGISSKFEIFQFRSIV